MILGVDVGGYNTDAVLMDGATLIASAKLPTTPDVRDGIVGAIRSVLRDFRFSFRHDRRAPGFYRRRRPDTQRR